MNEARDIPRVIAPPPLIALTTFLLGLALDWFLPLFMLREIFSFWTRFVIGAVLITTGMATAGFGWGGFVQAGTNVEPWKPTLSLVTGRIKEYARKNSLFAACPSPKTDLVTSCAQVIRPTDLH